MKRSIKAAGFLIGLLLVLCASVQANTLALGDQAYYDAAPELRWLDGGGRELTPEQALGRLRDGQGQRLSDSYPTLGFRQGDQWLLLPLANRSGLDLWYLRAARPHLDHLDLYVFDQDGRRLNHWRSGDRVPFAERPLSHYQMVFPLVIPEGARWWLLFQARGENVIDFPLTIRSPDDFNQLDGRLNLFHGFYFGAVAILCLFNLLIFLSIREPSYLHYVLYLGTFGLNLFAREGLAFQWLWPGAPQWNHHSLTVLNLLTLAFSMVFSCSFLELRQRAPALNRALLGSAVGLMVLAPISLLNFDFFIQFSSAIVLPWPFIATGLALWLVGRGYRPALFFLIAFAAVAVTSVIYILKTFNLSPGHWLIENAFQLGILIEALLLSFALAHRMTTLKTENDRIQREATEVLERRVEERTRELNAALSARGEFLAVMSHEIRTPLNSMIGTVDMLRDTPLNDEQRRHLHVIEQSGTALTNLIDDLLD